MSAFFSLGLRPFQRKNIKPMLNQSEFDALLSQEKLRSDQLQCPFTVIRVPFFASIHTKTLLGSIEKKLYGQLRATDEVGLDSDVSMAIFLFNTSTAGAKACLERLQKAYGLENLFQETHIQSYCENGQPLLLERDAKRPAFVPTAMPA